MRFKIQLAVENRSTGFEVAGPQPDYRHQTSNVIRQGKRPVHTPGISQCRRPAQTETLAGTGPWLKLATDSEYSHIPFPTSLRKAAAQGEERHWAVQPTVAGGTFLGPTGPVPRVRAPRILRKRLRPGLSEPEPAGAQYAPDTGSALRARLGSSGKSRAQSQARRTRMSHSGRIQPPAGLRWKTHMSRAGEVVIRKTPGHGTIRRGRFIKSRPEQFCCTAQLKLPL